MVGMSDNERPLLSEGKSKDVFLIEDAPDLIVLNFKDVIEYRGDSIELDGRGKCACETTSFLMKYLHKKGIETQFEENMEGSKIKCRKADVFPITIVSKIGMCPSSGYQEFHEPVLLFNKDEDDTLVSYDVVASLTGLSLDEVFLMKSIASSASYYVRELFNQVNLQLVELKLKFGKTERGNIILVDEISEASLSVYLDGKRILNPEEIDSIINDYNNLLEKLNISDTEKIPKRMETFYVEIMPRPGVKNPSGQALMKSLRRMGFEFTDDIKIGKVIQLRIQTPLTSGILDEIERVCLGLLSNPLSEFHQLRT